MEQQSSEVPTGLQAQMDSTLKEMQKVLPEELLKTLNDLNDEDFKEFKYYLKTEEPTIPVSKLEKADRTDTAKRMFQTYDTDCVHVTVRVLTKMKKTHLVKEFSEDIPGSEDTGAIGHVPSEDDSRCKEVLNTKSQLKSSIKECRHVAQQEPNIKPLMSNQQAAKAEVPHDICTGTKLKAQNTRLVCQHQLIQPVENLEDRMCMEHDKPLELFCKTDDTCLCQHCTYSDHKNHTIVPLKEEHKRQKRELKKTKADVQQMIHERRLKIQEIQQSVEVSKNAADRVTAEGVEVLTALMESVQRRLKQFQEEIQEKQRTTQKQAENFIKELEQEICQLEKRSTELEQLLGSEDHLHLVQSVKPAPPMKTWTKVSFCPSSYEDTVVRAVSELERNFTEDMKKVFEAELKRVQQYEVDLTLDPDTAHPKLVLSEDGKQVHDSDVKKKFSVKPHRFSHYTVILSKQSFSSGRSYFEVQVKGKTDWTLGVVRESINRKGKITWSPEGGVWTICLRNGNQCYAVADSGVRLSVQSGLQKVGVFVDHEEGLVSFYDVESSVLIYSFIGCCFNDKLLPVFNPWPNDGGKNSAPLIITPVKH